MHEVELNTGNNKSPQVFVGIAILLDDRRQIANPVDLPIRATDVQPEWKQYSLCTQ